MQTPRWSAQPAKQLHSGSPHHQAPQVAGCPPPPQPLPAHPRHQHKCCAKLHTPSPPVHKAEQKDTRLLRYEKNRNTEDSVTLAVVKH